MSPQIKIVRLLVVGDEGVGKTCLVLRHIKDFFPEPDGYIPKVAPCQNSEFPYKDKPISLVIWDMSVREGEEDFVKERTGSYYGTGAFLLCFSVVSRLSFENVKRVWIPELKKYARNVPIILVGMKMDLRSNERAQEHFLENNSLPSFDEGLKLSNEIKASNYIECSSLTRIGVKSVFEEAVLVSMKRREGCTVV